MSVKRIVETRHLSKVPGGGFGGSNECEVEVELLLANTALRCAFAFATVVPRRRCAHRRLLRRMVMEENKKAGAVLERGG